MESRRHAPKMSRGDAPSKFLEHKVGEAYGHAEQARLRRAGEKGRESAK